MPIASKRPSTTSKGSCAAPREMQARAGSVRGPACLAGRDFVSDGQIKSGREGSLEAPTRHALGWQDPQFYDAAALDKELERVFEICHGCRRCFNLCNSFPTLFDLIDASSSGEIDGVDKSAYGKVVDQCYLCDMCYMTKCPYVPPHPWNVDFPHLMLRAKAVKNRSGATRWRDKVLSATDAVGNIAGIPVIVEAVNAFNHSPIGRKILESALGVDRRAPVPRYHANTARRQLAARREPALAAPGEAGNRGKVALFATCYVNRNEPQIGLDLARVFEHNGIEVALAATRKLLRYAEARARRSGRGCVIEGQERSGAARNDRARLRYRRAGPVVRAHVQAGASADVPR